jgi:hypothetical protein
MICVRWYGTFWCGTTVQYVPAGMVPVPGTTTQQHMHNQPVTQQSKYNSKVHFQLTNAI